MMANDDDNISTAPPSGLTLVFDTETTNDAAQNLRIGTYQVHDGDAIKERGIFYDPVEIKRGSRERRLLESYGKKHGYDIISLKKFVEDVFYCYGYDGRGTIVGFNLAFDISRLAIEHMPINQGEFMRGGFTFLLTKKDDWPRVHIKHVSSKLSFFQFADKPGDAVKRRFGQKRIRRTGFFVDVKTLAVALTSVPHTLESLAKVLKTTKKSHVERYGGKLTDKDIDYAVNDTQVTWECYQKLLGLYEQHHLNTPPHKIFSEAALGKAYLEEMGIKPWQQTQRDFPNELTGIIMSTYYGGRAEVHIRREIVQTLYHDFLSMYPTTCTLLGLWDFLIAKGMTWQDATNQTQEFLDTLTIDQLQDKDIWPTLRVLVQVKPQKDIFPVRAKYGGDKEPNTIGVNYLTSDEPVWFTLADCVASKLLTDRAPQILHAIAFAPKDEQQKRLRKVQVIGDPEPVNPYGSNFFARIIDQRNRIKALEKDAKGQEKARYHDQQIALKILANATSYGIFVELNDGTLGSRQKMFCYSYSGKAITYDQRKYETPGQYFHPLLATLITGAARLMLAITERKALDAGLDWVFCDTDSMALAKPKEMDDEVFYARAAEIREWFTPLNPYARKEPILKCEDDNYRLLDNKKIDKDNLEPLFCFAVSAKRYVLFNKRSGEPLLRKLSAHGLGHLRDPYLHNKKVSLAEGENPLEETDEDEAKEFTKIKPWHKDFWRCILEAELNGRGEAPTYETLKGFNKYAASMFSASTPDRERWFKDYNEGKAYRDRVRPFNFLLIFKEKPLAQIFAQLQNTQPEITKKEKPSLFPVAPYDRDLTVAVKRCFDRYDGKPISVDQLATYAEDRGDYDIHSEAKFHNGERTKRGRTWRRHIKPEKTASSPAIIIIGKEGSALEQQQIAGYDPDQHKEFTNHADHNAAALEIAKKAIKTYKILPLSRASGISRQELQKIKSGETKRLYKGTRENLDRGIAILKEQRREDEFLIEQANKAFEADRSFIKELSIKTKADPSNILKMLRGRRRRLTRDVRLALLQTFTGDGVEPSPVELV